MTISELGGDGCALPEGWAGASLEDSTVQGQLEQLEQSRQPRQRPGAKKEINVSQELQTVQNCKTMKGKGRIKTEEREMNAPSVPDLKLPASSHTAQLFFL